MRRKISKGSPGTSNIAADVALKIVVSGEEIQCISGPRELANFEWQHIVKDKVNDRSARGWRGWVISCGAIVPGCLVMPRICGPTDGP